MSECFSHTPKCFLTEGKEMIPKNADLAANADRAALARMLVRAGSHLHAPSTGKRHAKNRPQEISAMGGNFLVRNPPKSVEKYPSQVGLDRKMDQRAALVAQDGLLPTPGLDQRNMLLPSKRKP